MEPDRLWPRESAKFVAERAKDVKVLDQGVRRAAQMILDCTRAGKLQEVEFAAHPLHPKDGGRDAVQWVFLMDTINFSFWPTDGKHFDVTFDGKKQTGWFAACAALNRALEGKRATLTADWMESVTERDVEDVFRSDSGDPIPLVQERTRALNEAGRVLNTTFGGEFYNVVKEAKGSARKLLELVLENFSSYRDYAEFEGQKVSFLKRAQILVADVQGALEASHDPAGDFSDFDILTMFADYRVPQALAFLGVLQYSEELMGILQRNDHLEPGSRREVELRAASIEACERIVAELRNQTTPRKINAPLVDMFLWVYRRQNAEDVEKFVPFHRTRGIYY